MKIKMQYKLTQARKNYKCKYCNSDINTGDNYVRIKISKVGLFRYCEKCAREGKALKHANISEDFNSDFPATLTLEEWFDEYNKDLKEDY